MTDWDRECRKLAADEKIEVPKAVQDKLESTLAILPRGSTPRPPVKKWPKAAAAVAVLLFAVLFVLPNVSVVYAQAMEKVPVLGELIRVVTIRNYTYDEGQHELDVQVPQVEPQGVNPDEINGDVNAFTQELVDRFYDDLYAMGGQGSGSVQMKYDVLTNTDTWFTLRLDVQETAASSNRYFKYYHIDRRTGKITRLGDLFGDDQFEQALADNIKAQMETQMAADPEKQYFVKKAEFGEDFVTVKADHNYYFNGDGDLVIPFDKYEVAPGYMGCPEFVIKKADIASLLKEEYR